MPSLRHILDARQFTREWLETVLFPNTERLQRTPAARLPRPLRDKRLFYLFYETSTRTRVSFEAAASLLGATVTGIDSHEHTPDEERLEDRIRVLNQYPYDFLLLRYHEEGGASRAAAVSQVPVINAGDGHGQHPTQALLDAYTLWREFGTLDGLRIALVGDLSYERSTNSLAYLLSQFSGLTVHLVSPQLLRMRDEVREHLVASGADVHEVRDLRAVAADVDVVYVTRAQTSVRARPPLRKRRRLVHRRRVGAVSPAVVRACSPPIAERPRAATRSRRRSESDLGKTSRQRPVHPHGAAVPLGRQLGLATVSALIGTTAWRELASDKS